MQNNEGAFNTNVKGQLLNLSKIEELLQKSFQEKTKIEVTADCGGKLRAVKTGDSFTCQIKNKQGQTRKAQITVTDDKGQINVKLL